jgi:ApbE superfamily uncharacterized protein (UPF0280 family)
MECLIDYKETHLSVSADKLDETKVRGYLASVYDELECYIGGNIFFASSLEPVEVGEDAPKLVKKMALAAEAAGVGPMAAVAGAFAQEVGEFILAHGAREVVVENGGDIYLKLTREKTVGIYAGDSEFSNKIALKVQPEETPCGVCTSSGTLGHSISFGEADAVTVVADSAFLADAAATAVANEVVGEDGVEKALEKAKEIRGIRGALIIKGGELAAWGRMPQIAEI